MAAVSDGAVSRLSSSSSWVTGSMQQLPESNSPLECLAMEHWEQYGNGAEKTPGIRGA